MQLDKTSIVIAQRTTTDIADLSLKVMRQYAIAILPIALLGAVPFMVFNFILTLPLTQYEELAMSTVGTSSSDLYWARYYCVMAGAVFLQAPLAFSFLTYFIGQAVFFEQQSTREVIRAVRARWFSLIAILGILRMGLISYIPLSLLFVDPVFRPEIEIVIYVFMMIIVVYCVRAFRPFAPEILVLEKCPLRGTRGKTEHPTYRKRVAWLHAQTGDAVGSHIITTCIAISLMFAICFGFVFIAGVLFGAWRWGQWMDLIVFPCTLWIVAAWTTVLRFLLYMDARIRIEGWEMELRLKAESERLREALQ